MKNKFLSTIPAAMALLSLTFLGASARAQHQHHGGQPPASQAGQQGHQGHQTPQPGAPGAAAKAAQDAHQALAMAYHQSAAAFARALLEVTERAQTVDGDFARDAVTEMRRSFDLMDRHHQDHMKAMGAEARAQTEGTMKQAEPHQAKVKELLDAIEREVGGPTPDPKFIAGRTAELLKHLDGMAGTHGGHQGH